MAAALLSLVPPSAVAAQTAPTANPDGSYTVPSDWALIPAGVEPGERFRLLFKTSTSRNATSTDIGDYNAFVQAAANRVGVDAQIRRHSGLFRAVGCTAAVSARANTDSEPADEDAKIFWLNGARLADGYADFYDGTWDIRSAGNERDETGTAQSGTASQTWTGCSADGGISRLGAFTYGYLGTTGTNIFYGASRGSGASPLSQDNALAPTDYPFYAMSPVFVEERVSGVNARFDLSTLDGSSPSGFVFRVCGAGGGGTNCDTAFGSSDAGWVPTLNPAVKVTEGGGPVSYQYKMHWPGTRPAGGRMTEGNTAYEVDGHIRVGFDKGAFSSVRNAYRQDRDRLNCLAKPDGSKGHEVSGIWGAYVKHQANRDYVAGGGTRKVSTNELWLHGRADGSNVGDYPGRTDGARVVSDMWGGCPFVTNSYPTAEYDTWQTVTLGAGHDADAFSHDVTLTHKVNWGHLGRVAGVTAHRAPQVRVHIVDDDSWDQNIEVAPDGTNDWVLLERQGLQKAFPDSMDVGVTYKFKVRLVNQAPSGSYSYQYSLHPQSGGVSIWTDKPYTDDPPYGVEWSWSQHGSINADDTVTVSVRKDSAGPLVIRQRAPGLRQRTDMHLPRNLGSDPGNPVTALASDATFTTKGYWFEEYSTVGCVGCPETNDDSDGGDGLTPDPNDGDGDGDGLTTPVTDTDTDDGDGDDGTAVVDPLVKYAALVKSFYDRISDRHQHGDSASGGWNKRFLKAMGHPEYVNYPQDAVTVARATELYDHGGPGANTAWEGTAEAIQYRLDYDAGTFTPVNPPPPDPVPVITISGGSAVTEGGTATFTVSASPAPATPITVNVGVSESGSFGAAGAATIAVSGAATTYTVTTADDSIDEPDGSVTATVQTGTGYTVGAASAATVIVTDDDDPPVVVLPEITISGGAAVTEGGTATFTISASPAPAAPMTVNVGVTQSGSFGASGAATLTVSGATTIYTVTTSDDDTDEPDGSVTATVQTGTGYTVGAASAATVNVTDDDDPPVVVPEITISGGAAVTEGGTATFTISASPAPASPITVNVGVSQSGSFGASGAATLAVSGAVTTYTVTTSDDSIDEPDGSVTATVQTGAGYTVGAASAATVIVTDDDDPPVVVLPEITISGGAAVTEGGTATFTISASPAPAAPMTVNVGVTQSGSFGASGAATLTVSGATTIYTVTTSDDDTDEPDGSVTATVQTGTGYTVGAASAATVNVTDDDDPPVVVPEITISGGAAVTEGGTATFTISASPAPASPITVNVGVSQSGSFGASGAATLAVSGAVTTYTVTTSDDDTDEPDGSVTATVQTGAGYTVGTASAATVIVTDDDDPPVVVDPTADLAARVEQLRDDYSAYADWATGTFHQYMVHYSSGEVLALLNSDTRAANSISNQALFFRAIRAAKGARDTDAAALFAEVRDHYNIKRIG